MNDEKRVFVDSNIVLYALGDDILKKQTAWSILFNFPLISVQVLNECSNVLIKKQKIEKNLVRSTLQDILKFVSVEAIGLPVIEVAWTLLERYQFSYFDSLILASSLTANCQILYSEDLQHGQIIDGRLTIINPFLPEYKNLLKKDE
jgi:predicted nucleic acid-binding protein